MPVSASSESDTFYRLSAAVDWLFFSVELFVSADLGGSYAMIGGGELLVA